MDVGPVLVSAAIIERDGRYLIAQRRDDDSLGGFWEFPGGKVKYGESPQECLVREIMEETSCEVEVDGFFDLVSDVRRDGKHIIILFFNCRIVGGEPQAVEHQRVRWVMPSELSGFSFPPSDEAVMRRLISH